jgi:hypothetical protein
MASMSPLKPGPRPPPPHLRRVKISPAVLPATIKALTTIMEATNESRGAIIDRLVGREVAACPTKVKLRASAGTVTNTDEFRKRKP